MTGWIDRVLYRIRQFFSVVSPEVDEALVAVAQQHLPESWRPVFLRLGRSEMAHVLRLFRRIRDEKTLPESDREDFLQLALIHDIGKTISRPRLWERILKTLLPLPNNAHPIVGARLLKRMGASATLVRRVRRHHEPPFGEAFLERFQQFDNAC